MDLGYARVSTAKQALERQVDALTAAGIPAERIYLDKKSGATTDRPGLRAVLEYARSGDVIVVHTLDRLGRTVRDTLNLIHDLAGRGVGVRNLADPIKVDSADPNDPMAQLAVVMLALFAQMERTHMLERVAHARSVAVAHGRQVGRPVKVDAGKLDYARRLRDEDGLTPARDRRTHRADPVDAVSVPAGTAGKNPHSRQPRWCCRCRRRRYFCRAGGAAARGGDQPTTTGSCKTSPGRPATARRARCAPTTSGLRERNARRADRAFKT